MEGAVGAIVATMMSTLVLQMSTIGDNDTYPLSTPKDLNKVNPLVLHRGFST